jgi:ubiquinone/menaquinone biosynthesis C-methylase UbiE
MLTQARENAEIAGVEEVDWREGNATELPFDDETFDVVLSALGHMYGDPPDDAARELLRVTRSGGRIGFTSWTPTSLLPSMAGLVVSRLSPEDLPEFSEPPFLWGDQDAVTDRLEPEADALTFDIETVEHRALSPSHFLHELATHSGLFIAFLDKVENRSALRQQLIETIEPHFNESKNVVEMEYLLTTATIN